MLGIGFDSGIRGGELGGVVEWSRAEWIRCVDPSGTWAGEMGRGRKGDAVVEWCLEADADRSLVI